MELESEKWEKAAIGPSTSFWTLSLVDGTANLMRQFRRSVTLPALAGVDKPPPVWYIILYRGRRCTDLKPNSFTPP